MLKKSSVYIVPADLAGMQLTGYPLKARIFKQKWAVAARKVWHIYGIFIRFAPVSS